MTQVPAHINLRPHCPAVRFGGLADGAQHKAAAQCNLGMLHTAHILVAANDAR